MIDNVIMVDDTEYRLVPGTATCKGCAAERSKHLCERLPSCYYTRQHIGFSHGIFKKEEPEPD